ncbi:TIGR04255 family protein [Arcicella sp. DC2W]|uniref:TIGR04255 family protein n=1 Tax=Arcicella gelida TaxID=2984195 RepID=A0ABU5S437_9BACT|nr:TIGR04255 family protein [Arcicella sp. DC2W]MEA5403187.1 TIGR04255 family protein [Arcicella sp. DC2W]
MFDFPDIPKTEYKRTFLRSSIFNIEFDYVIEWENHIEEISKLFKENFFINNREETNFLSSRDKSKEINIEKHNKTIEFKSKDGLNVIAFENNVLAIVLHGKSYKSFNSFRTIFGEVEILLKNELSNYQIKRLSERKVNIIDFTLNDNNGAITLKQLLNSELVGSIDYIPNINYIKQSINSIVFEKDEASLNIKYGYNKINDSIGQIILDLTMFTGLNTISNKNLIDTFSDINTELYRAFNWAITDDYKEIMKSDE